jgi:hypothetical protein
MVKQCAGAPKLFCRFQGLTRVHVKEQQGNVDGKLLKITRKAAQARLQVISQLLVKLGTIHEQ